MKPYSGGVPRVMGGDNAMPEFAVHLRGIVAKPFIKTETPPTPARRCSARFAETLPAGVHAVLLLDQAGWHGKAALHVPANLALPPLPPYLPDLNPVEKVWTQDR